MVIPEYLQQLLREAEQGVRDAQEEVNYAQMRIQQWKCQNGRHVFADYITPPIGRACAYCREPEPNVVNSEGDTK